MESFFKTLKVERVHRCRYQTREEARADIVNLMEGFYNSKRLHSALGYTSPAQFERERLVFVESRQDHTANVRRPRRARGIICMGEINAYG